MQTQEPAGHEGLAKTGLISTTGREREGFWLCRNPLLGEFHEGEAPT
jgi:hypothetical protein